jgi:hypothetical protein
MRSGQVMNHPGKKRGGRGKKEEMSDLKKLKLFTSSGDSRMTTWYRDNGFNPVPVDVKPRILSMMIDDQDNSASFDLVLKVGDYFGLENHEMKTIVGEVAGAVSTWRDEAKRLGISNEEINRMATAFEHDEMKHARKYTPSKSFLFRD